MLFKSVFVGLYRKNTYLAETRSCKLNLYLYCRYRVTTKKLMMTLRKSFKYKTVVRNVNRAFNSDVNIELFYDTYVDVENHKHAFFCQAVLRIRNFAGSGVGSGKDHSGSGQLGLGMKMKQSLSLIKFTTTTPNAHFHFKKFKD
jgi:hypothetical protein